jgi:hypothetical protein
VKPQESSTAAPSNRNRPVREHDMQFASVVAVVVTGAAAFAAGLWTGASRSELPPPQSQEVVLRRLDRLESSVADWIRGIDAARHDSPASAERIRDAPKPLESSPILAAFDELKTAVAELQAQLAATGRSSVPDAIAVPKNLAALAGIFPADAIDLAHLREHHFCWIPIQVYRTYGLPDASQSDDHGRTVWGYQLADGKKLYFIFSGGIVLRVTLDAPFRLTFPGEK